MKVAVGESGVQQHYTYGEEIGPLFCLNNILLGT